MTIPRIDPNDPKWTAYVLGELDAAEHAAVDRLLETSAEARALVAEVRTATTALDEAMATEPALVLMPAQRAALLRAAEAQSPRWFGLLPARRPTRGVWGRGGGPAGAREIPTLPLTPDTPTPPVPERVIATGPGVAAVPVPTANPGPGTPTLPAGGAV